MKRKQTVKGKDYPISANSKLASLDFARATNWASQIYAPLKLHESQLCDRAVFQNLSQLLVKVYATDEIHTLGAKKLFAGEIAMLTKWRLSPFGQWNTRLGVDPSITMEPHTGKASITLPKFCLSANQFVDRARQMALRFYVYVLDEEKEALQVEITDDLLLDFDVAYDKEEAHFEFPPMSNGVVLLVGITQLYLATANLQDVFASFDRRYYQANLIQTLAIKDGIPFIYSKKTTSAPIQISVNKVAWQRK